MRRASGLWLVVAALAGCACSNQAVGPDPRLDNMVLIPEGPFWMGATEERITEIHESYGIDRVMYEAEVPQRRVPVAAFYIDKTEVTQDEYARFVQQTGREPPFVDKEWAVLYNWADGRPPEGLGDHPVVLVSFYDAADYCRWAGKRLPTETEWEKAARGPDGRTYPWGDDWDSSRLNSADAWSGARLATNDDWLAWWNTTYKNELRGRAVTTRPAGAYPEGASPYGVLDMAGNVFEWTDAWYDAYPGSPYENPEFGEQYRVVRGGDWYIDPIYTRTSARLRSPPEHKVPTIGFRCALDPAPPEAPAVR